MGVRATELLIQIIVSLEIILAASIGKAAETSITRSSSINNEDKDQQIGVGLQMGNRFGLSFQYWLNNARALNGSITGEGGNTAFSLGHIWIFKNTFAQMGRFAAHLNPYIGLGAMFAYGTQSVYFSRNSESAAVAVQTPLGIEYLPVSQRFDIFAEVSPNLEVFPGSGGFWNSSLGARFFF